MIVHQTRFVKQEALDRCALNCHPLLLLRRLRRYAIPCYAFSITFATLVKLFFQGHFVRTRPAKSLALCGGNTQTLLSLRPPGQVRRSDARKRTETRPRRLQGARFHPVRGWTDRH